MNGLFRGSELPELDDEDALLLYEIAKRAAQSNEPPYKALYQARNYVLAEQGIEEAHDNVLFRWVTEVGERAHSSSRAHLEVDLRKELKDLLLRTQNISLLDADDESEVLRNPPPATDVQRRNEPADQDSGRTKQERRVSFGDAHVEETWLGEHSEQLYASPARPSSGLLAQPPRRSRGLALHQARARSVDSQHDSAQPSEQQPWGNKVASENRAGYPEETQRIYRAQLLLQPSQTQLEQNAEAFLYTTNIRTLRRCLHFWHDAALGQRQHYRQAYTIATSIDQRALLRQSFVELRARLDRRLTEKHADAIWGPREDQARIRYENHLVFKAFTHMVREGLDRQRENEVARRHMLRVRFFRRWKEIAIENAQKLRSILCRKYVAIWRERLARKRNFQEHAIAVYEERLMRSCVRTWNWTIYERRVVPWYEQKTKEKSITKVYRALQQHLTMEDSAEDHYESRQARLALASLQRLVGERQQREAQGHQYHTTILRKKYLLRLQAETVLAPLARDVADKHARSLGSKALVIWHRNTILAQEANKVSCKRVLQRAWTCWNDNLRIKALAQPIDERVLVENLYKWLLRTKLIQFQRRDNGQLVRKVLVTWNSKTGDLEAKLAAAELSFRQHKRRRIMSTAMICMNRALRQRDDGERAALEFANARTLPKVVLDMKNATAHARELAKWATDARWYCLASRTVKLWRVRTTQHQHQRRRDAYAHIRAKIKLRLANDVFRKWQESTLQVQHMIDVAEQRNQARVVRVGTVAFNSLRTKAARYVELSEHGTALDQQKLLASALQAMIHGNVSHAEQQQQANNFRHGTSLALLASALKCLEKAAFAQSCKAANAEAWNMRTRDQHIRQMLRHWAMQTANKRETDEAKVQPFPQESESPSLRPASRVAARSRSRERQSASQQQHGEILTPAYLRSPSRSARARASRFRPLPSVIPLTPMTFATTYYATTPAPLNTPYGAGVQAAGDLFLDPPVEITSMTPQITPFTRKLRAGGITPARPPPSALRRSIFGKSVTGLGTAKSVRFVGSSRFGSSGRSSDSAR